MYVRRTLCQAGWTNTLAHFAQTSVDYFSHFLRSYNPASASITESITSVRTYVGQYIRLNLCREKNWRETENSHFFSMITHENSL